MDWRREGRKKVTEETNDKMGPICPRGNVEKPHKDRFLGGWSGGRG